MAEFKDITLIKASAGSGKTYRLMKEVVDCVVNKGISPENLLVTTFTKKAAAELKAKMRQALIAAGKPEEAAKVFDGLIGTVDSVCERLLREYAVEAGLAPELSVLPEENITELFEYALEEAVKKHANDSIVKEMEEHAVSLGMNQLKNRYCHNPADWRKDVRELVRKLRENRMDNGERTEAIYQRSCESIRTLFSGTNHNITLETIVQTVTPVIPLIQSNLESLARKAKKGIPSQGVQEFYYSLHNFCRFPTYPAALKLIDKQHFSERTYPEVAVLQQKLAAFNLYESAELQTKVLAILRGVTKCAEWALEEFATIKNRMGLIDFIDMERKVVDLLCTNEDFRAKIRQRVKKIFVDEFQDTSPLQLELFLKVNSLCSDGAVWVGDPKQAIYGFRGTDPELIIACANKLQEEKDGQENAGSENLTLTYSWRSKENLVNFSNAIFPRVFQDIPEADVKLAVSDERKKKEDTTGGEIEAWHFHVEDKKTQNYPEIAKEVSDLLKSEDFRNGKFKPKDIAVLLHTNDHLKSLAKAFAQWKIPTTAPAGKLLMAPEVALATAGMRYCLNHSDSAARGILLALQSKESSDWLTTLFNRNEGKADACNLQFCKVLENHDQANETPQELLERVIVSLDLENWCKSHYFPDRRLANLEALRKLCQDYATQAKAENIPATPVGFLNWVVQQDPDEASGMGENCVNLLTYHKAKGLEWSIVILGDLDHYDENKETNVFGTQIEPAQEFNPNNPLENRTIRYWPYPFGTLTYEAYPASVINKLKELPQYKKAETLQIHEKQRVFYVGVTRAKERLIFAIGRKTTQNPNEPDILQLKWLERIAGKNLLQFPLNEGSKNDWEVNGQNFTLKTSVLTSPEEPEPIKSPIQYTDDTAQLTLGDSFPAKASPSLMEKQHGTSELCAEWEKLPGLSENMPEQENWLGNAFHDFFAVYANTPTEARTEIAERLIGNWQMKSYLKPETLIAAADHLFGWLRKTYPQGNISCEVPITCHDEHGTLYQGFIDMLVEIPDGFVILDHKTGGHGQKTEEYAASHVAQLRLYENAIRTATGKPVQALVIHLPLQSRCYQIK